MATKKALLISLNGKSNAGGVERVVYYLDEYFNKRGIPTKIIDEAFLINHTLFGKLYWQLFRFRHFKKRKLIYIARYMSAFLWVTKFQGNIVISHGELTAFYPSDFVFIQGAYHQMELANGRTDPSLSRIGALQKRSCVMGKTVVAVAVRAKEDIITHYGIPAAKILVQNNCVDAVRFHPIDKPATSRRTLLFVGRLVREKGLAALKQLAHLIAQSDNWQLLIACNETPDTAFFADIPHVTVKKGLTVDNIGAEAYGQGDLLIVPSVFEGFELVTVEALSSGKPVIGTRVGAISELLDRGFPGVYLLPDIAFDNPEILAYFDNILNQFHQLMDTQSFHQLVTQEFGIEQYMEKMDKMLLPAFQTPA